MLVSSVDGMGHVREVVSLKQICPGNHDKIKCVHGAHKSIYPMHIGSGKVNHLDGMCITLSGISQINF